MSLYTNDIPQPNDRPSDSQGEMLSNFQALKVFMDRNHVAIVDPTTNVGEGKHKFLQMPEQNPSPSTLDNEGALYTKEKSSRATLYWRPQSDGTEVQLTNLNPSIGANGYTFLPGGMLLQWGRVGFSGSSVTVSFPTAFTAIYSVTTNLINTNNNHAGRTFNTGTLSNGSFSFYVSNSFPQAQLSWMAVGTKV